MILLVDNYDSFTYNLVHLFQELGADVVVRRNDEITADEAERLAPSHLVISPGPGRPESSGSTVEIVRRLAPATPTLGVCLGHQAIIEAFGGEIGQAQRLVHGKASTITHDGRGIFTGLPQDFEAGRYHSLAATRVPGELEVSARTEDGEVMGVRHRALRVDGVQFHPESVLTPDGPRALPQLPRGMIQPALIRLLDGHSLSREEAREAMGAIMTGEATAAQIGGFLVALRLKGETRRRDRRLRRGDPRATCCAVTPQRERSRRHGRNGRRRAGDDQHLDRGGAGRGCCRRRSCQTRQQSRVVGLGLGRRARGARVLSRHADRADRALDRRARLRLPVRADPPSGDAARGAGAPRAGDADRLQRARPADQPGGGARAGRRRLRARPRADDRRGARAARRPARVRRPRVRRDRRAFAVRAEPRLRGRRRRGAPARRRPARARHRRAATRRAPRRLAGAERSCDPSGLRRRRARRAARRDPAERGRARSPRRATPRICATGSSSRARRVDSGAAAERLEALVAFSRRSG